MLESSSIRPSHAARPVRERDPGASPPPAARDAEGAAPQDRVTLSDEARARGGEKDGKQAANGGPGKAKLTPEQQREVAWLQARDRHVRQHEAAHQAAGGALAGGASFSYQTGPDGRSYAVGGEVPISIRSGRTPDETIANARQARRAALAPADPSAADLGVAAEATRIELAATQRKARLAAQAYGKQAEARGADGAEGEPEPAPYPVEREPEDGASTWPSAPSAEA